MWFPRLIAWLAVIGGLLILAVGLFSMLGGAWLAAVQALGIALGALMGGSIILVLLEISEHLQPAQPAPPAEAHRPASTEVATEVPYWMRKQA